MSVTLWWTLACLGGLLSLVGLFGCLIPIVPGPAFAYCSLWLLVLCGSAPRVQLLIMATLLLLVVLVLDSVLPAVCAKKFKCSRWGVFGCLVGSITGLFYLPFGIVVGPFLGTMAGELIAGKRFVESLRGGLGALIGFVLCVLMKFGSVGLFTWWFFRELPPLP